MSTRLRYLYEGEKVMLMIKAGQKLIDKESNVVYIIQNIKQENVILVSEDGEASMLLHQDSVTFSGLEPVYD
jgi:hypothetical protein